MAREMYFSIIYWNIWLDNQLPGKRDTRLLLASIGTMLHTFSPDCFGLNEVLLEVDTGTSPVFEYLKDRGYTYACSASTGYHNDKWSIVDAIVSKYPIAAAHLVPLYTHKRAKRYDNQPKTILGDVLLPGKRVKVGIVHLQRLEDQCIITHLQQRRRLSTFIHTIPSNTCFVLGGDFNEPTCMPFSFAYQHRKRLNVRTGSLLHPTWLKCARSNTLFRACPDKIFWTTTSTLHLLKFQVLPVDISDHKPLYAQFQVEYDQ